MRTAQMEMVSVEQLVPEKYIYRILKKLLDFEHIAKSIKVKVKASELGAIGFGRLRLVMCLILQYMERPITNFRAGNMMHGDIWLRRISLFFPFRHILDALSSYDNAVCPENRIDFCCSP